MIEKYLQISCDICMDVVVSNESETVKSFKKALREDGWRLGRHVLCPECLEKYYSKRLNSKKEKHNE